MKAFYEWVNTTAISMYLQESTYTFPVTEVIHLMGITVLLGAAIIVCLRLWGMGIQRPASELHEGLAAWTWFGLILVFGTGLILLWAEPIKLATNAAFPYKLAFLGAGLLLHFFGYLRLLQPGKAEASPGLAKLVALGIMICWFGAGVMGRAIGFV
jgi:hypothetical protein